MTMFTLSGKNVTYALAALESGHLAHVYFGKRVGDDDLSYLLRLDENPYTPKVNERDMGTFMDSTPFEYPCHGIGDYREPCIMLMDSKGMSSLDLRFVSYEITDGKPVLSQQLSDCTVQLPATFAAENEAQTLAVTLCDKRTGLDVILYYTVFADLDVITRSVKLINKGAEPFDVRRVLSGCVDFDTEQFDFITLNGSWARERVMERCRLHHGKQGVDSVKGESSHQNNPFVALVSHNANEDIGEAYGFNLVYSGNFFAQAEVTQHKKTRLVMGINHFDFSWKLLPEAEFTAPELVMVYSSEGIGSMSRTFHDLYRQHLIRGEYKDKRRP
ncbi:MAG: alpha-galactosidase, partial [Oscillospiraceae bacterium]|nr:alpha-galactosidase [Oscillospiraceae bacterium]